MPELPTLSETTSSSIDFAKAVADFGALSVMAGVLIVLVLLMFAFFMYQLFSQQKSLAKIALFSEEAMVYFKDRAMRMINLDQARGLISIELNRSRLEVVVQVIKIKENYHLENRDRVERTVTLFLDRLYASNIGYMNKFEYGGQLMSMFFDNGWKEIIRQQMIEDCENKEIRIHQLNDRYSIQFLQFQTAANQKIDEINY